MNKICFYNQSRVSVTPTGRVTPGKVYTPERTHNMEKEAYYFPHFSNARHDRKIKRLRKELGIEGYGIFFMLLETLRDQIDLKYPMSDIDLLADEFGTSEQKIRTVIANYQLFELDESELFFSPRMLVYLQPYFSMKEQRKIAGLASAEARRIRLLEHKSNDRSTDDEQKKVKEKKVKESKITPDGYVDKNSIPPKIEWVTEYCNERKNNVTPQKWYDFYQSKNWMIGKNKMKDWQAAVRTWEQNNQTTQNQDLQKKKTTEFKYISPYDQEK